MKFLELIKAWLPTPGSATGVYPPQLWGPDWVAASGQDPARRGATTAESMGLTAVHRAVSIFSDATSAAPKRVLAQDPRGGAVRVTSSDVARCLATTSYEDWEGWTWDACRSGNGYLQIFRNARGAPSRLSWVPAWRVILEVDTETAEYRYRLQADPAIGAPETVLYQRDVCHLKYRLSGKHPLLGVTPLVDVAPSLDWVLQVQKTGYYTLRNMATPQTVLRHPKRVSPQVRERLSASFRDQYFGRRLGGVAVLEENMQLDHISIGKLIEMQYEELSRLGVKEVARAFGVPPTLLAESGDTNRSQGIEEQRGFFATTLHPWSVRAGGVLSEALLSREDRSIGQTIQIDLSAANRGFGEELANFTGKMLNSGAVSVNESRSWVGLPPVEHGDTLRAPSNTVALPYWDTGYRPGQQQAGTTDESASKALPEPEKKLLEDLDALTDSRNRTSKALAAVRDLIDEQPDPARKLANILTRADPLEEIIHAD